MGGGHRGAAEEIEGDARAETTSVARRSVKLRRRPLETLVLGAVLAVMLLPLVRWRYFPTQDGASHLENAAILRDYHDPGAEHLRAYYTLSSRPDPTWLGHLALAALSAVLPSELAERIFAAGCIVGLVLALRYALRGFGSRAAGAAFLGLPFASNFLLHMGFYSFLYSVAGALIAIGFSLRRRRFTVSRTVALAALVLLVWALHPVSAVVVMVFLVAAGLVDAARFARSDGWRPALARHLLPRALACVPAALAVLVFAAGQSGGPVGRRTIGFLWRWLATGDILVAYDRRELLIARSFALLLAGLALAALWRRRRRPRVVRADAALLGAALVTVLYFLLPDAMAGGAWVSSRLGLFAFLLLVIWLAAQPWRGGERRVVQVAGALAAVLLLVARVPAYRGLDVQLRDYLSVSEHLAPRSTLLPISFASRGMGPDGRVLSIRVEPLLHAAARLAVERDVVNLGNYEAASTVFPVRFRPEIDPYRHLGPPRGLMRKPPQVEITGYDERTPGRIDYVLVWGPPDDPGAAPARAELEAQLRQGWERTFESPRGWTQLYGRR